MSFDASDVIVIDDAVSPDLLIAVLRDIKERGFQFGWHSNRGFEFSHWNVNFGGSKKARKDVLAQMPECVQAIWRHLDWIPQAGYRLIRGYCNAMPYGAEGWPHTDSQVETDKSLVIYLNPEWETAWYGETVIFDEAGEIVRSIMPKFGRLLIFPGAQLHAARAVSRICPQARYVLVMKIGRDK